jgi:AraC-like DNA-binding protein
MGAEILAATERSYDAAPGRDIHPFWQLVLPIHGVLEMRIEGQAAAVDSDHFAAIPPGAEHVYRSPGQNRFLIVDLAMPEKTHAGLPVQSMTGRMRSIVGLFREEASRAGLVDPLINAALGQYIGAAMAVGHGERATASPAAAIADRARALIESDPSRFWSIEELAHAACASPRHLARCFHAAYGVSPARYARSARLGEARRLLSRGMLSVGEVAVRSGFVSQPHFTRAFAAEFGMTPGTWQRSVLSGAGNPRSESGKPSCGNG